MAKFDAQEDEGLLQLLKNGDERAFATLFASCFSQLVGYVFSFVKDQGVSQDIVQDAFVKLWNSRSTIDDRSEPKALLFTICKRLALNELRSVSYSRKARDFFWEKIQESRNTTDECLEYSEMERIAKTAIRMLPSRQQEVFLMSRDDGLSHQEIAGILNISKNTVNNLLVKAIKNVRDALKEVGVSILLVLFHNLP